VRGDEALARFTSQMDEFRAYLDGLFAERRARPGSDLISALLQADEQGDALTDTELYSMIVLLVVAGHITTVSLIGNAVLALLRHPDQLEALRADPGLMPSAIEEFLRYDTPSERTLARWPVEDVEIRGQQIPEGSWVVTLPSAANRDPDRFERPDELDLARAENRHLAFGRGVHYCVGAGLARVEGEIALSTLLRRIPSLRLAATEALEWRRISLVRALGALPVAWDVPAPLARQYSTRSR
jgi:cytochrome P450